VPSRNRNSYSFRRKFFSLSLTTPKKQPKSPLDTLLPAQKPMLHNYSYVQLVGSLLCDAKLFKFYEFPQLTFLQQQFKKYLNKRA